jgi:hypothetical protein
MNVICVCRRVLVLFTLFVFVGTNTNNVNKTIVPPTNTNNVNKTRAPATNTNNVY